MPNIAILITTIFFLLMPSFSPISYAKSNELFGMASWYGPQFHGKQTANGEIYDMNKMTAAHKTLPFGTILKVTNLSNNKYVVVRVNDRGPFVKNRVLDLSKKAAHELDFREDGVVNIKADILKMGDGKKYHREVASNSNMRAVSTSPSSSKEMDDVEDQSDIDAKLYEELETEADVKEIPKKEKVEYQDKAINKINPEEIKIEDEDEDIEYKVNRIFVIQFAAFSEQYKAENYKEELSKVGIETYIAQEGAKSQSLYKVREKKTYRDIQEVLRTVVRFKKMGLDAFAVGKFFIPKIGI